MSSKVVLYVKGISSVVVVLLFLTTTSKEPAQTASAQPKLAPHQTRVCTEIEALEVRR